MPIRVLARPDDVGADLRAELLDCWVAVVRAGGAVGFPDPATPVADVSAALDGVVGLLPSGRSRLLVLEEGALRGWVVLEGNPSPVAAHWATVRHLQVRPERRRRGGGAALMAAARRVARDDLGLTALHLAVRDGEGLDAFYVALGWRVVGRWPGALRLAESDVRDELLLQLRPL